MGDYQDQPDLGRIIADLFARVATLERLAGGTAEVHKTAFPLAAGWANYGAGYEAATYSRLGRCVTLQGLVTKSGGTPTLGDVVGTLPDGYRPTSNQIFPVATGETAAMGRIDVQANGDVVWRAGATTEADYTSLSGVSFLID